LTNKDTKMADLESLLQKIQSNDPNARTEGWLSAGEVGAPALKPLAALAFKGELEVGRAAQRAMWKIVRHVGHPAAAADQKQAAIAELADLLANEQPLAARREVLWMLSEIAGDDCVDRIAAILNETELREDARMVLDRIPGQKSLDALQAALARTADDFRHNLAQSLRHRGVDVPDIPCRKLVPTR
jgi:hypothetical protein